MCSPSWTLLPPPSPYHPSGSSQCTSPKHPVSCIKPGLATSFIHDIIQVSNRKTWGWNRKTSQNFFFYFIFKLYNIVLVLPNIEMNPPQVYPRSPSWTLLPPPSPTLPLGRPSAPAPSIQYRASNLDWRLVSYMMLYLLQCYSPKSPHPLPLPQSPQDWSIHWCLFCCLVHRVIVTIFLNSIYMR